MKTVAVLAINKHDSRINFLNEVGYSRYILLFLCKEKVHHLLGLTMAFTLYEQD